MWFRRFKRLNKKEGEKTMNHLFQNALVVVAVGVALVGCEWTGGGDNNSWNDSTSIANFSGNYQANGGYLVSDYSSTGSSTGSGGTTSNGTSYVNHSETQTKHVQLSSVIAGNASYAPILPTSFSIVGSGVVNGLAVHDDGSGNLTGSSFSIGGSPATVSGYIVYQTGSWGIILASTVPVDASTDFLLTYSGH